MSAVREAAQGKWRGILKHFGVEDKYLKGMHTSCPVCQQGDDRYRFSDYKGNGDWICTYCGYGSGFDLLMALKGWTFKEAATNVEEVLGKVAWVKTPEKPTQDVRRALNNVYAGSRPVRENDETHRYLKGRGLTVLPPTLRTHPGIFIEGRVLPAMLAVIVNVKGEAVSLHQTFIDGGRKANVDASKQTMKPKGGEGATNGCAIRLWDTGSDTLHLAEGIETSCAVRELTTDGDVWATKDAHLMEVVKVPEHYKVIHVWADNDPQYAGQAAAFNLAKRLSHQEGKEVHVHLPNRADADWLDVLCYSLEGQAISV
jgi:putative DNA primase/helicase